MIASDTYADIRNGQMIASESDATIYVDAVKMGIDRLDIVVLDNSWVTVKAEKVGFLEDALILCNRKNSPKLLKTYYYIEKRGDDQHEASVQLDIANIDREIRTNKPYEDAWKLINQIGISYSDAIEIMDKETGYFRTSWGVQSYTQNTIRTRIIVKLGSEYPLSFKIKRVSEISCQPLTIVKADELFRECDRVLRKYASLNSEIQCRL